MLGLGAVIHQLKISFREHRHVTMQFLLLLQVIIAIIIAISFMFTLFQYNSGKYSGL